MMGSCDYSICHKDVSLVRFSNKFRFPNQFGFTIERVCIGFISSKADVVALFLYQPNGSLEPFVFTEEH